ncbi:MAG: AbrB/MazE/SpoVT family DNA-binding domain-containing protein [Candidatus Nomurabacteria bacterium]|nr:MAG: AbrB/MazE/SpoVT family DNA-binding domain-containing protein [Candidatus Nomurabacteria bacterium]
MHPSNKKLYGTATIGSKGQVVIPAEAREELNLRPGDRLYVVSAGAGGVVFLKEEMLENIVDQMSQQVEGFREYKKYGRKEK